MSHHTPHLSQSVIRRHSSDTLVLAWLHGQLSACLLRRNSNAGVWTCPDSVTDFETLGSQVDQAIQALNFEGADVSLVLAHPQFHLQPETTPPLAEKAARQWLQNKVERANQGTEAPLSALQPILTTRKELSFLIHQVGAEFYRSLNAVFQSRKLELTRLLPALVPLQALTATLDLAKDKYTVLAAETGASVTLLVARGDGQVLLARTLVATWQSDVERIAAEINRTALYAKQQYGIAAETVLLLGSTLNPELEAAVAKRLPKATTVGSRHLSLTDLPAAVGKIPPRHPANLLANFLTHRRNIELVRRSTVVLAWLGVALALLAVWNQRIRWNDTLTSLEMLKANEASLRSENERLTLRNRTIKADEALVHQLLDEKRQPVPAKLLVHLAAGLPKEVEFTDFSARLEGSGLGGTFRIEGQVHSDEEGAQEIMSTWLRGLSQSPFKLKINEAARTLVNAPAGADGSPLQRFSIEGGFLDE